METSTQAPSHKTHPMILVAAAAVTIASLAAVASIAGWLPGGKSEPAAQIAQVAPAAAAPLPQVALSAPSAAPAAENEKAEKPAPSVSRETKASTRRSEEAPARRAAPRQAAKPAPIEEESPPAYSERTQRGATPVASYPASDNGIYVENSRRAQTQCIDCGVIENIREIKQEGQGTGLGAIAGGIVGGLLGNQIGNGSGRKIATVAAAAGGAYAGHSVEKHARGTQQFQVTVRLDDGTTRTINESQQPVWRNGDRVRISNGAIVGL